MDPMQAILQQPTSQLLIQLGPNASRRLTDAFISSIRVPAKTCADVVFACEQLGKHVVNFGSLIVNDQSITRMRAMIFDIIHTMLTSYFRNEPLAAGFISKQASIVDFVIGNLQLSSLKCENKTTTKMNYFGIVALLLDLVKVHWFIPKLDVFNYYLISCRQQFDVETRKEIELLEGVINENQDESQWVDDEEDVAQQPKGRSVMLG